MQVRMGSDEARMVLELVARSRAKHDALHVAMPPVAKIVRIQNARLWQVWQAPYRLYLGIADGTSIARVRVCRYSNDGKGVPLRTRR